MKIVLMNAAAPEFVWEKRYDPASFADAVKEWENTAIRKGSVITGKAEGYHIYRASSLHARQTAEDWLGAEAVSCEETSLLDEIPLKAYTDGTQKIALWRYRWRGYLQWRKGDPSQPENYEVSLAHARKLCDMLEKRAENVVLISHERRIKVILRVLRERAYQIRRGNVFRMDPLERILAAKDIPTCGGCMHNCQLSNPGCPIGREKALRQRETREKV